jgi:ribonuclease T2
MKSSKRTALLLISIISSTAVLVVLLLFHNPTTPICNIKLATTGCTPSNPSFDALLLALQWPPTYAHQHHNQQSFSHWTIHGLWPSRIRSATYPCNCENIPFNLNSLPESLQTQMEKFWPTLFPPNTNEDFWQHEWSKHGTCYTTNQSLYFSITLNLLSSHNPAKLLAKASITPRKEPYEFQQVADAMFPSTIGCANNPEDSSTQFLEEVGICFDPSSFKIIQCLAPNKDELNDCDPSKRIYLLPVTLPEQDVGFVW